MNKKILGFSIIGLLILLAVYFVFAGALPQIGKTDVSLVNPPNNNISNTGNITFSCMYNTTLNVTEATVGNLSVYHNISGIWGINDTNITMNGTAVNMSIFNFSNNTIIAEGIFIWTCRLCLNMSNCSLTDTNHTLTVDRTKPTVVLNAPTNNSFVTNATVEFVVTATDNVHGHACMLFINSTNYSSPLLQNFNFSLDGVAGTGKNATVSYTSGTRANISINISQGTLIWNYRCNDSANWTAWASANYTLSFDITPPFIYGSAGLNPNRTLYFSENFTSGWTNVTIIVNETIPESRNLTCNLSVENAVLGVNKSVVVNNSFIVTTVNSSAVVIWNRGGFVAGENKWNVTCSDVAGNINRSPGVAGYFNLTVRDQAAPSADTPTVSSSSVTKGTSVTLSACNGSDNVDTNLATSLEVKGPLTGDDYSTVSTTFSGTTEVGTYTVRCKVTDDAGNVAEATTTFSVTKKTQTYEAAGAAAPTTVAVETIRAGRISDVGILTEYGASKLMAVDSTLTFTIDAVAHSAKVKEVGSDYVVLEISSDPMEVTVKVDETKEVDLDNDGVNDLEITLHGISYGKGDLTFKRIKAVAEEEVPEEEEVVAPEEEIAKVPSRLGLWITILVIIIVVVVGYYMVRKRKGKKAQVKFTEKDLK